MIVNIPLSKKDLLEKLLEQSKVNVSIDCDVKDLVVPEKHIGPKSLTLNLSYKFAHPVLTTDWGVAAKLTFDGEIFECHIPWRAIYLMIPMNTEIPFLFEEDTPQGIREQAEQELSLTEPVPMTRPLKKSPFQLIKGGKE